MPALIPGADQPRGLLTVLTDSTSEYGDRHDAAMDLGVFDEPEVEAALLAIALNLTEDPDVADAAGESLSEIWRRKGSAPPATIANMHPAARKFFQL